MNRHVALVLYVVAMIAIIVGVDFAFLKNQFWERLAVNIGIVLVFGAFYWWFPQTSMMLIRQESDLLWRLVLRIRRGCRCAA